MSTDEKPIEGEQNDEQQQSKSNNERPAGQVEGSAPEPTADEVQSMYDDLGIKAKAPSGKSAGRPKASDGGNKKASKQDDESGKSEKGRASDGSSKQSKAASSSNSDGSDGDDADSKGEKSSQKTGKDGKEDGKVSGSSDEDAEGVSSSKPSDDGKTPKSGEDDSEEGDSGAGKSQDESGSEAEKKSEDGSEEEQGKRPGKSNPEVEKRMQRLAAEKNEALERAEKAEKALRETSIKQARERASMEDPEYTVDDFRKVRDNKTGEIKELDTEQAELAWRRWKDGYDQRATERQARENYEAERIERAEATTRKLMQDSADAYDAITGLMDEYPELVEKNPDGTVNENFDEDFAAEALPLIEEAIEYLPGTEPGNSGGKLPVIAGLRIDPKKILKALKGISNKKRSLPLNGMNDNAERPSNVNVPHGRSSDQTVNQANDLMKELGINKRF